MDHPTHRIDLHAACEFLNGGGLIAYPTEAVWGLGCDPFNEDAVRKILALKGRPAEKGLIVVASGFDQISELLIDLPKIQTDLLLETWPGPTTWLIPDSKGLFPRWIKGQHDCIAMRVSAHPIVRKLCKLFGKPIVSTSANRTGGKEIKSKLNLELQFADKVDYIVEGELGGRSSPSEIRDLLTGAVIR